MAIHFTTSQLYGVEKAGIAMAFTVLGQVTYGKQEHKNINNNNNVNNNNNKNNIKKIFTLWKYTLDFHFYSLLIIIIIDNRLNCCI